MRRRRFLLALGGLAGCARDPRPRLNVFNWSNYIAPETIPAFEKEFGVRVRYGLFESTEEVLARISYGNSGWDVAFPPSNLVKPLAAMRLLQPLRHDLLPNLSNLETRFLSPAWDPGLRWSMPYMWGSTGILYNRRMAGVVTRWADLWEERFRGRITMHDDAADTFGACLKKIGHSVNATSENALEAAKREAIRQKPLVRAYLNAEAGDQVVSGDLAACMAWAMTAQLAIDKSPDLSYCYPAEGFPMYCDVAVVLRESRRTELAHKFLNFLLRGEVTARIVEYCRTATANRAAWRLLPEKVRNLEALYPPPEVVERGEWIDALPPKVRRLRDRLWTEVKMA